VWPKVEVVPEECAERDCDIPLGLVLPATSSTLFVGLFVDTTVPEMCAEVCAEDCMTG
jgi:hypothetical protein